MSAPIDLTGRVFGNLTVLGLADKRRGQDRCWRCACSCGNMVVVVRSELKTGDTKSCGCLRKETAHLQGKKNTKHGCAREGLEPSEYRSWVEMRRRCTNRNSIGYRYYGGRGIAVCERWSSFENFLADMGKKPTPRHSIDRYPNNDGNYEPGNCRWATAKQQASNRRKPAR